MPYKFQRLDNPEVILISPKAYEDEFRSFVATVVFVKGQKGEVAKGHGV